MDVRRNLGALVRGLGVAAAISLLLTSAVALAQTCPSQVPNFRITGWNDTQGNGVFVSLAWNVPPGVPAGSTPIYEIWQASKSLGPNPSSCFGARAQYQIRITTTTTTVNVGSAVSDAGYQWTVRVSGCPTTESAPVVYKQPGSLGTPTLSLASTPGTDVVTITYSLPDDRPDAAYLQRSTDGRTFVNIATLGVPCGTTYPKTFTDSRLAPGTYFYRIRTDANYPSPYNSPLRTYATTAQQVTIYARPQVTAFSASPSSIPLGSSSVLSWTTTAADSVKIDNGVGTLASNGSTTVSPSRTTTYTLTATGPGGTATATTTVTVRADCPLPSAPVLKDVPGSLVAGQSLGFGWSEAQLLLPGGTYVAETSWDRFATLATSVRTTRTRVLIPTSPSDPGGTLSVRVRAVQPCSGLESVSEIARVGVSQAPAFFQFVRGGPAWMATAGSPPAPAEVKVRNVGGLAGQVSFTAGAFFAVSPPSLDLPPGGEGKVTLNPLPAAFAAPGVSLGALRGTGSGGTIATPVSLAVAPPGPYPGGSAHANVSTVTFRAPTGQLPAVQRVTIMVPGAAGDAWLSPSIGPGGAWLTIGSELGQPVPKGGSLTLTLGVDRTRRTPDEGMAPLRTLLTLTPVGGDPATDGAVIEVVDVEPPQVTSGAGLRPQPQAGFILPSVVRAPGAAGGQLFRSDGWLRNHGSVPVDVDLFLTPEGANGMADGSVRKARVTLPPGATYRLSDLVLNVFGVDGLSGQVELRSLTPWLLSVRGTVESEIAGDATSRYGTEMPPVPSGGGVGLGDPELIIPGVDDDAANRANVILAETSGAPATAQITIYAADGSVFGQLTRDVPPYGKRQVNRVVDAVAPGGKLSGGWASVKVIAGAGRVVAVATVIDNASGSFAAAAGLGSKPAPSLRRPGPAALADSTATYVIPTSVRTTGAYNTQYSTNLSMVNGTATASPLALTYTYTDLDAGQKKSVTRTVSLPARGSLPKDVGTDVLVSLFGVPARSFGSIFVAGGATQVTGLASITSQVDPNDPAKGFRAAQVNGTPLGGPAIMDPGGEEHRFSGAEKSLQKRTNLILLEVANQTAAVVVRAYGPTGAVLAEKTLGVGAGEYKQINDVFGPDGLNLGDGPFSNVEISARVSAGNGRVLAFATVVDNVSKNPEIFFLEPAGPPADPAIGF